MKYPLMDPKFSLSRVKLSETFNNIPGWLTYKFQNISPIIKKSFIYVKCKANANNTSIFLNTLDQRYLKLTPDKKVTAKLNQIMVTREVTLSQVT